jgi:hypothetical protein
MAINRGGPLAHNALPSRARRALVVLAAQACLLQSPTENAPDRAGTETGTTPDDTSAGLGDTDTPAPNHAKPNVVLDPSTSLDFGPWPKGCPAPPLTTTIRNTGTADLTVQDVQFDAQFGLDAFELEAPIPQVLSPGGSMEVSITFTPTDVVRYDQIRLKVDSDDPDEPVATLDVFGEGVETTQRVDAWTQVAARDVDVLWVLDNSGSMSDDLLQLSNAIGSFIAPLTSLGIDYHVAVTTTDTMVENGRFLGPIITGQSTDPVQAFRSQIDSAGDLGSADEAGLDASYRALTNASLLAGPNAGFLRTAANLAVVVVSDEDDYSQISVPDYNRWLNNFKGDPTRTSFSGLVGPAAGGLAACSGVGGGGTASAAPRYHTVIRQTEGTWGDFCTLQLSPFFSALASLAAGLQSSFPLSATPSTVGDIDVTVSGVGIPYGLPNGWTYDATTNAVALGGTSIPQPGNSIEIHYPAATGASCP